MEFPSIGKWIIYNANTFFLFWKCKKVTFMGILIIKLYYINIMPKSMAHSHSDALCVHMNMISARIQTSFSFSEMSLKRENRWNILWRELNDQWKLSKSRTLCSTGNWFILWYSTQTEITQCITCGDHTRHTKNI